MNNKRIVLYTILLLSLSVIIIPLLRLDQLIGESIFIENGLASFVETSDPSKIHVITGEVYAAERLLIESPKIIREQGGLRKFPELWGTKEKVSYASQTFEIKGLQPGEIYGFYLQDALTAYSFFVDGKLIAVQGKVSDQEDEAVPASKSQSAYFIPRTNQVSVVVWVSNYEADKTGIWQKTYFGSQKAISAYEERANISDAFNIGAIFFISIYLWILFIVHRKDHTILYFAICCTSITIKSLFAGQQIGFESYTILGYGLGLRLAYFMVTVMAASFMAFVCSYFVKESHSKTAKIFMLMSFLEAMVVLFTPQAFYMSTFWIYQLTLLGFFLIVLYWVYKALRNKTEGAFVCMLSFVLFFGFAVNDILYSLTIVHTGYFLGFGLIILIMAQATLIAIRLSNALSHETYINQNLELIISERTRALEAEKNRFENLSKVDSLTLLYNKGYLMEVLEIEYENYKRYNGLFSLIMMDLDHFKAVNDNYGHVVGDQVLRKVAEVLRDQSGKSDIVGRFGGEEFLIIMRFTGIEDAVAFAEHLRMVIMKLSFNSDKGPFSLTASFGVAEAAWSGTNELELLTYADEALYKAKRNGRNRVETYK